jgi:purine-cytosine permease-like protein
MSFSTRVRRLFSRENLPKSKAARIAIGVLLVIFGLVGFLPILGFWMVPAGLAVLAIDIPVVRRFTRKASATIRRWWHKIRPARHKTQRAARR